MGYNGKNSSTFGTTETVVVLDKSGNAYSNNFESAITSNVSTGITTLTASSSRIQNFSGGTGLSILILPDATTLKVGQTYEVSNNGSNTITVETSDTATLFVMEPGSYVTIICLSNGSSVGQWDYHWQMPSNANYGTAGLNIKGTLQSGASGLEFSVNNAGNVIIGGWEGTPVTVPFGGTGDSSFTAYAPVVGGTTTTGALQSASTGIGTAGFVLTSTGASSIPTFQSVAASGAVSSLTPETGGAISPSAGTINLSGNNSSNNGFGSYTSGSGNTVTVNSYGTAKWVVNPTAGLGTHQTITAALASASAGDTIFITSGTYTEDFTLKNGVALQGYDSSGLDTATLIVGKMSFVGVGFCSLSGLSFEPNGSNILSLTGGSGANNLGVFLNSCKILVTQDVVALSCTATTSGAAISLTNCTGAVNSGGCQFFANTSGGEIIINNTYITNGNGSAVPSTMSAGRLLIYDSSLAFPISTSGTASIHIYDTSIDLETEAGINAISLTLGGSGTNTVSNSIFASGSASAISVSSALNLTNSTIFSSNTNAITGVGTLTYGGIVFGQGSSGINVTTQNPTAYSVAQGGTGDSSFTAYAPIVGGTTTGGSLQSASTGIGTSGFVLTSTGASSLPTFQSIGSSGAVTGLQSNVGSTAFPTAGIVGVLGNNPALNGYATFTDVLGSDLLVNSFGTAKWIVNPTINVGTHQTIAGALASASSGDVIFITAGQYNENITLKTGVTLVAYPGYAGSSVIINGKCSYSSTGITGMFGIELQTNSDYALSVTGTNPSIVNLFNCYINCSSGSGIQCTSNGGSSVNLYDCLIDLSTTGVEAFDLSSGTHVFRNTAIRNGGGSTSPSTVSSATLSIFNCYLNTILTSTSSTFVMSSSYLESSAGNGVVILTSGTATVTNSYISTGSNIPIFAGSGTTVTAANNTINSSATNVFSGTGAIKTGGNVCVSSSGNNVTTITHLTVI